MHTLTFCRWYAKTAVYHGDTLILYAMDLPSWHLYRPVLAVLGCEATAIDDIPTHDFTEFHEADKSGWWVPPASLAVLREQVRQRKRKELRGQIERTERALNQMLDQMRQQEGTPHA